MWYVWLFIEYVWLVKKNYDSIFGYFELWNLSMSLRLRPSMDLSLLIMRSELRLELGPGFESMTSESQWNKKHTYPHPDMVRQCWQLTTGRKPFSSWQHIILILFVYLND